LSWAEAEYLVSSSILLGGLIFLIYFAFVAFKRFRFMDGTATSKIRSAAQGQVELKGLAEFMQNDTIYSPFSGSRCVWYHCSIDKKKQSGKRSTWTNISDEFSSQMFRLEDDTGECYVDPDDAHVIPESELTWYVHSTDSRTQPPRKTSLLSLNLGSYRFCERLIRPATPLYALGWFRTQYNYPSDEFISNQVEDLVKQWKLRPGRYLQEYDLDQNGKIQKKEWKAVRTAARKQVLAKINNEKNEHHILTKPTEKSLPYILSAIDEDQLVARKKLKAYVSIAAACLLFGVLALMFSIRPPYPFN